MGAINETLRTDLLQPEFSEGYAESFLDAYIAAQIKVLREENHWTQADLAKHLDTTQTAISRIENVNYSAWNIRTLKKLARAFRLRLKVSFETYGSLVSDFTGLDRESLKRTPREKDPELLGRVQTKTKRYHRKINSGRLSAGSRCFRAKKKIEAAPRKPVRRDVISHPMGSHDRGTDWTRNTNSPGQFFLSNGNSTGAGAGQ
jgi:transcriptional regulator with XRE-family HTH domain